MLDFNEQLAVDFANMLESAEFAKSVSYNSQATGQVHQFNAIFEAAFARMDRKTGISTTAPTIFFKRDDLPVEIRRGDAVTVEAEVFRVSAQHPDGIGGVIVFLTRHD